ncbi:cation:proton antiporter [Megasphaera stantonii]|uniref:cation:proton antiporter domain-containing protein n=1 Tax=Megasphaera stantonii TaxID=2144175 RepID=UPI0019584E8B|nr:cation:proton antiporter [Megasphaera stantonii]
MHAYHLLEILAIGFGLALLFGYIARRIGLSPIVGYLAAGFLIGPNMPGFVADQDLTNNLAEVGIILLMFGVGLHFHMDDLLKVKGVAIPGAILQSLSATLCGIAAAMALGYSFVEGLFLGLGLSVASTVVLLRVLTDSGKLPTIHGTVAVGWLVVEDIFTVLMLVLLPAVGPSLASGAGISLTMLIWAVALAVIKLAMLWGLVIVIGGRCMPWMLKQVVQTRSQELFTLTVLAVAFLTAVGAAYIFNASFALGAFLGGMVVGKSHVSHQAGAELIPLRDAFAILFFLSVGMLFDPQFLIERPVVVIVSLLIVVLIKPLVTVIVVAVLGYSPTTAFTVAASLAQVGEFSFILAQTGYSLQLISRDIFSVLIVCAMISIAANPFFMGRMTEAEAWARKQPKLWRWLTFCMESKAASLGSVYAERVRSEKTERPRAIIAGYGPTGRRAAALLERRGMEPVVVDMNLKTVSLLNEQGKLAMYGDVSREEVLKAAGAEQADCFIITIPDVAGAAAAAMAARNCSATIKIFARSRFLNDEALLKQAGADSILFEEDAVAHELSHTIELYLNDRKAK